MASPATINNSAYSKCHLKSVILFDHDMPSELERLREEIRELEVENDGLRRSQQTLATEQKTLQHVATQLINAPGMQSLYDQIVDTAVAITHSDFATIQMFYPKRGTSGELRLLGHRGFSSEAAKRWEWYAQRRALPAVRLCALVGGSPPRTFGIAISWWGATIWKDTSELESSLRRPRRSFRDQVSCWVWSLHIGANLTSCP